MGKIQKFERALNDAITEDCSPNESIDCTYVNLRTVDTPYGKRYAFSYPSYLHIPRDFSSVVQTGHGSILLKAKLPYVGGELISGNDSLNKSRFRFFQTGEYLGVELRPNALIGIYLGKVYDVKWKPSEWVSYAFIFDGTVFKAYQNGVYKGSLAITQDNLGLGNTITRVKLGKNSVGDSFNGQVSDVVLTSDVLSDDDIMAHHNDELFDYDIHCSTSLDVDTLSGLTNNGYSNINGTAAFVGEEGELNESAVGVGIYNSYGIDFPGEIIPSGDNKDFTMSIWVRPIGRWDSTHHYMWDTGVASGIGYGLQVRPLNNPADQQYKFVVGFTGENIGFFGGNAEWNELEHLAVTSKYDSDSNKTKIDLYRNGEHNRTMESSGYNNTEYIDEFRLFNKLGTGTATRFRSSIYKFDVFDTALSDLALKDVYYRDLQSVKSAYEEDI